MAVLQSSGETESEFEETRRMIEELPFTYLHVFTFSARPGTPAATMPDQVPVRVARQRNRILRELAAEKKQAFMRLFVGQKIEAITLNVISEMAAGESTETLTDNYLKMKLAGRLDANQWLKAEVSKIDGDTLIGNAIREYAKTVDQARRTEIGRRTSNELSSEGAANNQPST